MNLKTEREKKRMSMQRLGEIVGVSAASICRYENGERRPRIKIAKRIEQVLGIPWYVIIEGKEEEKN